MPYVSLYYTFLSSFYKTAVVFKEYSMISKSIYNLQFLTIQIKFNILPYFSLTNNHYFNFISIDF